MSFWLDSLNKLNLTNVRVSVGSNLFTQLGTANSTAQLGLVCQAPTLGKLTL